MDVLEMLDNIIKKYGFESKEAIGFASDMENGDSEEWLKFLYYSTMARDEKIYP